MIVYHRHVQLLEINPKHRRFDYGYIKLELDISK
jgi:hypothetical protein